MTLFLESYLILIVISILTITIGFLFNFLKNENIASYLTSGVIIIPSFYAIYITNFTTIFISNPKELKTKIPNKKDIIIEIKLKKGRTLIVPFKWYYSLENKNYVKIYGIDDYITYIFGTIF